MRSGVPTRQPRVSQQARHVVEARLELGQAPGRPTLHYGFLEPRFRPGLTPVDHLLRKRAVIRNPRATPRSWVTEQMFEMLCTGDARRDGRALPVCVTLTRW